MLVILNSCTMPGDGVGDGCPAAAAVCLAFGQPTQDALGVPHEPVRCAVRFCQCSPPPDVDVARLEWRLRQICDASSR
jgi:hypothetical protein